MKEKPIDNDRWNIHEVHNKHSSGWYVRFNKNGIKANETFAFNPKKPKDREKALEEAKSWRNDEWESITQKGVSIKNTSKLTLRSLLEEYLATETPKKKPSGAQSEATRIKRMLNDKTVFKKIIDKPVVKLGRDVFTDLSNHLRNVGVEGTVVAGKKVNGKTPTRTKPAKPMEPSTANRYLQIFSCVFKYAMKKDAYKWIPANLAEGNNIKVIERRKSIPSTQDLDRVLAESDSKYLKLALILGFETGARRGEIMSLKWEDIKLTMNLMNNQYPHINFWGLDGSQKNQETTCKTVPLSERAYILLNSFDESERWGWLFRDNDHPNSVIKGSSISQAFKRARIRTAKKYEDDRYRSMVFHNSRGAFITLIASSGNLTPFEVASLSGHKSLNVIIKHYFDPKVTLLAKKLGFIKEKKEQTTST